MEGFFGVFTKFNAYHRGYVSRITRCAFDGNRYIHMTTNEGKKIQIALWRVKKIHSILVLV